MAMTEHYEDLYQSMKEISCEAEMLLHIGKRLTKQVTGQDNAVDGVVMETLTSLYVARANYEQAKTEYMERERQLETKRRIDEAAEREKLRKQQDAEQRDQWMQQWRVQQNQS